MSGDGVTTPKRSESEVDQCERIRDWAERLGFDVYPEVSGWDLVLVNPGPDIKELSVLLRCQPGHQIGIHAKLRPSCDVLLQAAPPLNATVAYPHFSFVAVPSPGQAFMGIAQRLHIGVIDTAEHGRRGTARWTNDPMVRRLPYRDHAAIQTVPLNLPPVASRSILAGAPSPRVLSTWRVAAIRFVAWARTVETWTIRDLESRGIGRAWAARWGEVIDTRTEVRRGRSVRVNVYRLISDATQLPDATYQDVAAELLAADLQAEAK